MSINTCEYSGPRGKCIKPTEINGRFCDRHRCPCEGCDNPKASSDATCGCGGVVSNSKGDNGGIVKGATLYGATLQDDVSEYDRKRREAALRRQQARQKEAERKAAEASDL